MFPVWMMLLWQPYLSTTFHVFLDTASHTLRGEEVLVYPNVSTDTLPFVWVHLYPNAYRKNSIYAREAAKRGDFRIHRASPEDLGGITITDLKLHPAARCSVVTVPYEARHRLTRPPESPGCVLRIVDTEGQIWLPRPLLPGETLRLSFAFTVKIPAMFSRMGRAGNTYILSQWYPKMVVYDTVPPKAPPLDLPEAAYRGATGFWHPDGYHYTGEFYGEFGTFRAEITVPRGFVVGATGSLTARLTRDSVEVYRFLADSVHDFAFAASPDFAVKETTWQHVTIRVLFRPRNRSLYDNVFPDIPDMLGRFSRWFGTYPYPVLTVVDGPLRAGGGMEYPMLVVIAQPWSVDRLRGVLAHEIAHQWFYGIYANNEMDEAWLDESWTSWATDRYMDAWEEEHPDTTGEKARPVSLVRLLSPRYWMGVLWRRGRSVYLYRYAAGPENEPVATQPAYGMRAYFATIYNKGKRVVRYAEHYLGDSLFERYLEKLYQEKALRHVHIADVRHLLREMGTHPERFLDPQLFDVVRDVRFGKVTRTNTALLVRLAFDGPPVPVQVRGVSDGDTVTRWVDTAVMAFPPDVRVLELDPEDLLLEGNEWNNRWGAPAPVSMGFVRLPEISPRVLSIWGLPVVLYGSDQGVTPGFVTVWTQGTVRHTGALYGGYGTRSHRGEGVLVWMERPFMLVVGSWQGSNDQSLTLWPFPSREVSLTLFRERVFDTTYVNPQVFEPGEHGWVRLSWSHEFRNPWMAFRMRFEGTAGRMVRPREGTYGKFTGRVSGDVARIRWVAMGGVARGDLPKQEQFFLEGEGREAFPWSILIPSRGDWATTGKFLTLGEGLGGWGGRGLAGTRFFLTGLDLPLRGPIWAFVRTGWLEDSRAFTEGGALLSLGVVDFRFPFFLSPSPDGETWAFRFYLRLPEFSF